MSPADTPPLVSIITPAYNLDHYLKQAVESVIQQDFTNWEMIVIDDGSTTDGNRRVVESFSSLGSRLRYYYQKNAGAAAARNTGISMARGRYLALLDADDRYLPGGLGTLVRAMEAAPPRVKLVYGHFLKHFEAENRFVPTRTTSPQPRPGLFFQFLVPGGNPVAPCACLVDKATVDSLGGFDKDFLGVEDRELWSRLVPHHDIAHVDVPVSIYRKHDKQITKKLGMRRLVSDRQVLRFFSSLPLETWFPQARDATAQAQALHQLAVMLLQRESPPFDSALHMLRLAQQKHYDHPRSQFITQLDAQIPLILREQFGSEERILTEHHAKF